MNKESRFKLVIFDLDGTLVDTVPDLAFSLNQVFTEINFPVQKLSSVTKHMGNGMRRFLQGIMTEISVNPVGDDLIDHAYQLFLNYYTDDHVSNSRLYPEVINTIKNLQKKDIKIACVTNKLGAYSDNILKHFELDEYISLLLSGDSLDKKKPDPLPLIHACDCLNVERNKTLMVVDSEVDVHAAKNADIPSVYMEYGYGNNRAVANLKPDYSLDEFQHLLKIV